MAAPSPQSFKILNLAIYDGSTLSQLDLISNDGGPTLVEPLVNLFFASIVTTNTISHKIYTNIIYTIVVVSSTS